MTNQKEMSNSSKRNKNIFFIILSRVHAHTHAQTQTHTCIKSPNPNQSIEGNCIRSEVTDSIGPIASITELTAESRRNPRESQESGIVFSHLYRFLSLSLSFSTFLTHFHFFLLFIYLFLFLFLFLFLA